MSDTSAGDDVSTTIFNMTGQKVGGNQIIASGNVNVDHMGNKIETGGGDYVSSDKTVNEGDTVYGDKVDGDKVDGDKISVGNISDSTGIAIGRETQANVNQGISGAELNQLFAPLLAQVAQQNPTAVSQVNELKEEAGKGKAADDEKIADLVGAIAEAAPAVIETIINLFTNSVVAKAAGVATKYILKRLRQ